MSEGLSFRPFDFLGEFIQCPDFKFSLNIGSSQLVFLRLDFSPKLIQLCETRRDDCYLTPVSVCDQPRQSISLSLGAWPEQPLSSPLRPAPPASRQLAVFILAYPSVLFCLIPS